VRSLGLAAGAIAAALLTAPASALAITVTSTADTGPGSLRAALVAAAPGETIDMPASAEPYRSGSRPA
jgi:hypothetical protein